MIDDRRAATYTLTVPTEAAAREVADHLAGRGHLLVAVRIVDHFSFDPESFWYGKPSMQPEFSGWWNVFSVVLLRAGEDERPETRASNDLARRHGGVGGGAGGGHAETVLKTFTRVGMVHELTVEEADLRRTTVPLSAPAAADPVTEPFEPPPGTPAEMAALSEALVAVGFLEEDEDEASPDENSLEEEDEEEDEDEEMTALDMFGELWNAAMHQGDCYPHTAGMVPVVAGLAADDRLGDFMRF